MGRTETEYLQLFYIFAEWQTTRSYHCVPIRTRFRTLLPRKWVEKPLGKEVGRDSNAKKDKNVSYTLPIVTGKLLW